MNKDEAREAAELARLNAMTWEQLNPDWTEGGDLTDRFAKSQFDTCPSCGEIDQIRVVNSSWDDVMASVLCCSWQCNGDCPSEAIDNWNRRAASVPRWTKWDWDDASTWPQTDGFYLCTGGFAGELPACDEWMSEQQEFRHYGIYGYWMPYVPPYTEDTDEQR